MFEDYTHIQSRTSTEDEAELDEVIEEKYINRRQRLTAATAELDNRSCDQLATCDKTSEQKIKTVKRKPKVRIEDAEATADRRSPTKTARKSEGTPGRYGGMMSKLLRQQDAPDVDIDIFSGDPVDYNYFIVVFGELVEKKIDDPRGRLARLTTSISGLQVCKIIAGRKVWESALYSNSLPKGNQVLVTTQTSRWSSIQEIL